MEIKYMESLTGLRGLAVLIVFISHAANEGLLPYFFGHGFGQIGVMIFFLLSGFLMAHLYISEDFNRVNVRKYILARIGRVVPLYFMVVFLSVLVSIYEPDFVFNLTDSSTVFRALAFIDAPYIFWTIPVEVQFYFIFIGFWFIYKKNYRPTVLVLFFVLTLVPSIFLYAMYFKMPHIISLYSPAFFLGLLTALMHKKMVNSILIKKIMAVRYNLIIFLVFLNLPILREQYGFISSGSMYLRTWGDPITWCIVYSLFVCAVLSPMNVDLLNKNMLMYLGTISYGFYLIHYPVLMFFKGIEVHALIQLFLTLVCTLIISHCSLWYFEKPIGLKFRNLFVVR